MRYEGFQHNGDIRMGVKYRVEKGVVRDIEPTALADQLYAACLLAHTNFENALHGCQELLPTSVEAWPTGE